MPITTALLTACLAGAPTDGPGFTTIVTHGLDTSAGLAPWVESMGQAIVDRAGLGAVFVYQPATGAWRHCAGDAAEAPAVTVLLFDWIAESNGAEIGPNWRYPQAAGDALAAALRDAAFESAAGTPILDGLDPLDGRTVHFIAHSRGVSVQSEATLRLAHAGIPVDHVTHLDPHPVNGQTGGCLGVCTPDWGDPDAVRWSNIAFADIYYRQDSTCDIKCDFDGFPEFTPGAIAPAPFESGLDESALSAPGYVQEHSDVHLWYHGTMDTEGDWSDGEQTVSAGVRPSWFAGGDGSMVGFALSALGGLGHDELDPGVPPAAVETPCNGTLVAAPTGGPTLAGWVHHGGGWTGTGGVPATTIGGATVLTLGAVGAQRFGAVQHNRFFLEPEAGAVAFAHEVITADPADVLVVELTRARPGAVPVVVGTVPVDAIGSGLIELALPPDVEPGAYTLRFALERGLDATARVHLDDIAIVEGPVSVPGDVTGDGVVNVEDLLAVLGAWGPCAGCAADLDGDGVVGVTDLLEVLAEFQI